MSEFHREPCVACVVVVGYDFIDRALMLHIPVRLQIGSRIVSVGADVVYVFVGGPFCLFSSFF